MTYPDMRGYYRKLAVHELRSVRRTFAYCRSRQAGPLHAYETEERRAMVLADMRAEARATLNGMRQVLHALFD